MKMCNSILLMLSRKDGFFLCPESPRLLQESFLVFHEGLEKAAIADGAAKISFASISKAQTYRLESGGCS